MPAKIAKRLRGNALALLALFVALGGTSYAAAGGFVAKNGRLAGCVGTSGALKVLKSGHRCPKGQSVVAWNVAGRPGAAGATGARGATGETGSAGPSAPESQATLTLGGPVHLDSAEKVSLVCSVEEGLVETRELTAIRVGTLHEQ